MPKSRHSNRIAGLILLTIGAMALIGCYRQPEPPPKFVPGSDLYDQFTSQGSRVVVDSDDDAIPTIKLRQRTRFTRVYDDRMVPVGRVYTDDAILTRSVDGQIERTVDYDDDSRVATLDDGWSLRQTDDGWTLYDTDDAALARFLSDVDGWSITSADGEPLYTVSVDDHSLKVVAVDDDRVLFEILDGDFPPSTALALTIGELEPLDRYAVAAWLESVGGE